MGLATCTSKLVVPDSYSFVKWAFGNNWLPPPKRAFGKDSLLYTSIDHCRI